MTAIITATAIAEAESLAPIEAARALNVLLYVIPSSSAAMAAIEAAVERQLPRVEALAPAEAARVLHDLWCAAPPGSAAEAAVAAAQARVRARA